MGQLTNQYVSQSYQGLLKLDDSTTGVTGTLQYVQDGLGNNLPMLASTSSIVITGSFRGDGSGLTGVTATFDSSSLVTTSSFNAFTSSYYVDSGSFDQRIDGIIAGTGSYVTVPDFNVYTSSIDNTLNSLETATGSLQLQIDSKLDTGSFNAYTSSNDSKVNALISVTGSYATTSSLSTLSGSIATTDLGQNNRLNSIESITGSLATTASLTSLSSSIATTDLGQNNRLSSLETTTGSLQLQINQKLNTGSFNAYTSSNDTKVNDLISKTGSYVTETESGSFVVSVTGVSDTITVTKGNGTTNTVTVNNVASASFAQNAISSSFAVNATSASLAQNAISSSFATNAISSSYATNALSASYAPTAVSSSYATNAATASIANDLIVRGKCDNLAGLTRGTIVRIVGANGDNPLFDFASWENDNNSANTLGMLSEDVAYNGFANVVVQGKVLGINTNGMPAGALLFLSSSGQYTTSSVPAPYHEVRLGQVLRDNTNNGSAYITIDNGYELNELHDVDITSPAVGDVLTYISGSYGQWVNKNGTELGYASTGSNTFQATQVISGSLYVTNTIYATSASFTYVTSSQIVVTGNTIAVNIAEPAQRFGGLVAYDSGSSSATASLLWDSQRNHWIYENVTGSSYSGGGLLSGPRNTGSLGDETYPTLNTITRGQGGDHLYDSNITDDNTVITMKIKTDVSGSLSVTNGITGSLQGNATTATSASHAAQAVSASHALNSNNAISSSFATNAISSSYSTNAGTAVSSSFATNANTAVSSSFATNAISSSQAQNAVTASFALNVTPIDTSSFATTGSNTFIGNQVVTGSIRSTGQIRTDDSVVVGTALLTNNINNPAGVGDITITTSGPNKVIIIDEVEVTGSLIVTDGITGSLQGSASFAQNAISSSQSQNSVTSSYSNYAVTASYAMNVSPVDLSYYATTGSNTFNGNQIVSGSVKINTPGISLDVTGSVRVSQTIYNNDIQGLDNEKLYISNINGVDSDIVLTPGQSGSTKNVIVDAGNLNKGLLVSGSANVVNAVTASFFRGDGSAITNVVSSSYSTNAGSANTSISSSQSTNSNTAVSASQAQNAVTSSHSLFAVTASFALNGGGGSINTGSFATTGSNTFNGNQIVSGSITVPQGYNINANSIQAAYDSDTVIESANNRNIYLGPQGNGIVLIDNGNVNSGLTVSGSITAVNAVTASFFKGDGSAITNVVSSSFAQNAVSSSYAVTASFTPFAVAAVTASYALNANVDSGSFATTGSNVFRGDQYISGSADISGSLFIRGDRSFSLINRNFSYLTSSLGTAGGNIFFEDKLTTSTVSQSLVVSSSNNIIFNKPIANSITFDSVIPGTTQGSNIFSAPPTISVTNRGQALPISMSHNIGRGTTNSPFILTFTTGSVTGSATINNNFVAGTLTYNAPQIGRLPNITGNNVIGAINYNAIAQSTNAFTTSVAPSMLSNYINAGSTSFQARSGSIQINNNNINGNASTTNNFTVASASHYVTFTNNSITNNPTIEFLGTSNVNQPRAFSGNILSGLGVAIIGRDELTTSGSLVNSLIVGQSLTVTASHADGFNGNGSATFIGRFNATGSFLSDSAQTIFAVGTGLSATTRRTSLHVSSSGLFSVRDGLNLSGSFSVTGSSVITGSIQGNVLPLTVTSNTASLNLNNGNFFELALTGSSDIRIEPSNIKPGQTVNLKLNTTGSGTVSFPTSVKQVSGSSYVPSTGTTTDIVTLVSFDSTNLYLANVKNLI